MRKFHVVMKEIKLINVHSMKTYFSKKKIHKKCDMMEYTLSNGGMMGILIIK